MPDALPAVTVPSLSNAGFNFARVSLVVSARGNSSVSKTRSPFFSLIVTGIISSLNLPELMAVAAFACEFAANSSYSSRLIEYFFAIFSAVTPI